MESEKHKCTACSCEYTDDEGGVQGCFGMMLMSFCPTCLSCVYDMVDQLNPREWFGLTDEEIRNIAFESADRESAIYVAETKLRERNDVI